MNTQATPIAVLVTALRKAKEEETAAALVRMEIEKWSNEFVRLPHV